MKKEKLQFSNLVSREERHYCAYLFSWFLMDKRNIKAYFENHSISIFDEIETIDFLSCEVYYEYTAIRELIYFHNHVKKDSNTAKKIKLEAEKFIFNGKKGDIQKKKADFAFYYPTEKKLVLTEAKFEMDYDKNQFGETELYGEFLKDKFPDAIRDVKFSLLGSEFYNKKHSDLPSISWEKLTKIIDNKLISDEIVKGLNYQKTIHKKAMKNWGV